MFIELTRADSDETKIMLNAERIVLITPGAQGAADISYAGAGEVIEITSVIESYEQVRSMLRMARLLAT